MEYAEGDVLSSRTSSEVALVVEVVDAVWGTQTKLLRFGDDGPFIASYNDDFGLDSEWKRSDE